MRLLTLFLICTAGLKVNAQLHAQQKVNPLIIIDTLFTYNETMIAHPSKFVSITTMNPTAGIQLYGDHAKFGVIRIQARPEVQWARLNVILDRFNIESRHRNLKVSIDRNPVGEPDKILADLTEIQTVEIVSGIPRKEDREFYINIVTQPASR